MKPLPEFIDDAWRQLKDATTVEDWGATKEAFARMQELQQINQDSAKAGQTRFVQEPEIKTASAPILSGLPVTTPSRLGRRRTARPTLLRIGDEELPISMNNQIVISVANWILEKGHDLPEVHNFIHASDAGFSASAKTKKLSNGSFMEVGDSQDALIQKARRLLSQCGFGGVRLEVVLEDGTTRKT